MLQACLPSLSHYLKPSPLSPWRCPLSLAGSHSSDSHSIPPLSCSPSPLLWVLGNEIPISSGPQSSVLSSFSKASPKLDNHFQQPQLPRLSITCNIVTFSPSLACPMPTPSQPCRSLQGFHKTCVTCCHSLLSRCHALPLAPQWLSTALCLALCSGIGFMIQPLKRLKTTWIQAASAKKSTHRWPWRQESWIYPDKNQKKT